MRKNQCITAIKLIIANGFCGERRRNVNKKIRVCTMHMPSSYQWKISFGIYDLLVFCHELVHDGFCYEFADKFYPKKKNNGINLLLRSWFVCLRSVINTVQHKHWIFAVRRIYATGFECKIKNKNWQIKLICTHLMVAAKVANGNGMRSLNNNWSMGMFYGCAVRGYYHDMIRYTLFFGLLLDQ